MDDSWRTSVEVRLATLTEAVSGIKSMLGIIMGVLALLGALMLGFANHLSNRMDRLETKLDAIPARIDAIGDKNQAAMVGLATAIASGITAARTPAPAPEAPK